MTEKGGAATRRGRFGAKEQTISFADDQGFEAANGSVSDAVSIRTIPAGKGPEPHFLSRGAAYAGRLCQTGGWGCQIAAGDGPDPQRHRQPAWYAESVGSSVLWCLAPGCAGGRKHIYTPCGH